MKPFSIVGVLNVTPDSYYDGAKYSSLENALDRAAQIIDEGGDIIDIGGESTFVDRDDVSIEEELNRTINVIKEIHSALPKAKISIDTYKAEVASKAIESGAHMINDVTAGRGDPHMFSTAAELDCPIVLMFAKDETSRTTTDEKDYDDVIQTVKDFLAEKKQLALDAGVREENIILDPGLGFFISGVANYSYEIIGNIESLNELGSDIFISPSRKSFLAGPDNLPPNERLPGTIAASVIAYLNGARYIRTHDVLDVRRALDVARLTGRG